MLLNSADYIQNILDFRSTVFRGGVGSGKTLLACATALHLLKTRRVRRIYSNIPFVYASSPHPAAIETTEIDGVKFASFNWQHPTAYNAAYVMDEAWVGLGDYKKGAIRKIFAFPRKGNQVFLLTSVLELQGVSRYVFHYVDLYLSTLSVGVPFRVYSSSILHSEYKPLKFSLVLERELYGTFDTDSRPSSLNPIMQDWPLDHRFPRQKTRGNMVLEGDYEGWDEDYQKKVSKL